MVLLLVLFFLASCSDEYDLDDNPYHIRAMYKMGDYDYILSSESKNSILFKGMINEYVEAQGFSTNRAFEYYSDSNSKNAAVRKFMYCFLYCEGRLESYFYGGADDFGSVGLIYAAYKYEHYGRCNFNGLLEACALLNQYMAAADGGDDWFFQLGVLLFETANETNSGDDVYEIIYYIFKKLNIEGDERPRKFLAKMYRRALWVPKDLNMAKRVLG
ncbi:hypothetical protein GCM10011348_33400 [Marinobacterium nitratireducens]|uniref:Uncharacterized protein n=2 Tax=Marinobacterium nitratireducens TaxID=518897 RepID=A0A917ZK85_9GAMM|nr:hypothetical protein GCM10011348_33400 [Marinobacterium nitratireducens]